MRQMSSSTLLQARLLIIPFPLQELSTAALCKTFNIPRTSWVRLEKDLLGTLERGAKLRQEFHKECVADDSQFLKTLKRVKVQNFAAANTKKKPTREKKALGAAEGARDAFAYLLSKTGIDLHDVLCFPISLWQTWLHLYQGEKAVQCGHTDQAVQRREMAVEKGDEQRPSPLSKQNSRSTRTQIQLITAKT